MERTRADGDSSSSTAHPQSLDIEFCQLCGSNELPCIACPCRSRKNMLVEHMFYPRLIVEHENKILLCKRTNEPLCGRWELPGGWEEFHETFENVAIRKTREKTNLEVEIVSSFAIVRTPLIFQNLCVYVARLKDPNFSPDSKSLEFQFFPLKDIPFEDLAYSSTLVALKLYIDDKEKGADDMFHFVDISRRTDKHPSEVHAYTLDKNLAFPNAHKIGRGASFFRSF